MKDLYRTFDEFLIDTLDENVKDERMCVRIRGAFQRHGVDSLEAFAQLTIQEALEWNNFGKSSVAALIAMGVGTGERDPKDIANIVDVEAVMNENLVLRDLTVQLYGMLSEPDQESVKGDMAAAGIEV